MSSLIYHVSFPNLNINIALNPIAFSFANTKIYWYGIILAIGFSLAYLYVLKNSKRFEISKNDISNLTIVSSICAVICARLYYVIFYPGDFYIKNPSKIFMINEGGIAIYGAIIGGILSILIFAKIKNLNAWRLLDITSLGVLIGQFIGRWGNFVNQEAFGTTTNLPWAMASENTLFEAVHPCFLYESVGCFAIFIFLHFYSLHSKKLKAGDVFILYMLLYGILRSLIEGLRTDSLMIPYTNLRISQVLGIALSLGAVTTMLIRIYKKHINIFGK